VFQSTSPDELAYMDMLQKLGLTFFSRTLERFEVVVNSNADRANGFDLETPNEDRGKVAERRLSYDVLAIMPFTSSRKRMSVVVRMPDGKVRLYCKGADSALIPLCMCKVDMRRKQESKAIDTVENKRASKNGSSLVEEDGAPDNTSTGLHKNIVQHVEMLAREGLRTMVMCTREIEDEELEVWLKQYREAERVVEDRSRRVDGVFEMLEHDLELVGCTGVEDRLQDGCAETIEFFLMVCDGSFFKELLCLVFICV
jgi:phospholipid-translocating ATPase